MCGELYYHRKAQYGAKDEDQNRQEVLARFGDDRELLAFLLKQERMYEQRLKAAIASDENGVAQRSNSVVR